jgi:hypothetical protein
MTKEVREGGDSLAPRDETAPPHTWRGCVECGWEGPKEATAGVDEYGDEAELSCPACNSRTVEFEL